VYLAATLLFPWVALLLLEAGLRIGGYGNDYPLFTSVPDRPDFLVPNQAVAKRYFGDGPFVPTPQLDFFHASKRAETFRIVFQGESSAIGFPILHGGAPSRMIGQQLQEAFPARDVEVINTALTAVNSYTLLDFADEIIAQHPDVVMIYTGHNEYYGAFGAGSASRARNPGLVRAYLALRKVRLVQLASNIINRGRKAAATGHPDDAPRNVMELMSGEQRIPLRSPRYEAGLEQFRSNLDELLSRYRAHDISVFIGTVASNERDQPPFVGSTADSLYRLAKNLDSRGDRARAAQLYRAAKENDELRFRAPDAINAIIREVAARQAAHVVETERALEQASPDGIIGHTLMLEHLHPNVDGYFVIARAFLDALNQRSIPAEWPELPPAREARAMIPVTEVDSLVGIFRADRLTSGWPFQPKGTVRTPVVDTLQPKSTAAQLAQAIVLGRMSWPEAMDRLRTAYEQAGDADHAVRVSLAMAQEYRYSAQPYVDAARIEVERHNYDAALRYVLAATRREETAKTVQLAGLLLLRQGAQPKAVRYLQRSVELAPNDARMAVPLRSAVALPDLEQGRVESPRDTTVLYALAGAYALTQQYEKSREALAELQRIAPNHAGARQLLERIPRGQ